MTVIDLSLNSTEKWDIVSDIYIPAASVIGREKFRLFVVNLSNEMLPSLWHPPPYLKEDEPTNREHYTKYSDSVVVIPNPQWSKVSCSIEKLNSSTALAASFSISIISGVLRTHTIFTFKHI
jgi:hypothetical protein